MKFYNFVRHQLKLERNSRKELTVSEISEIVAVRIKTIWRKASITTTVSHKRVYISSFKMQKNNKIVEAID